MDFKSLISKLDSMEAPPQTPKAPELPKKIRLDEDAELRVLAGTSTILAEAAILEKKLTKAEKAKKEEVVKSMKKDKAGFKERYGKRGEEVMHATATKIAKKKAESRESDHESLSEVGLDMNLIKAAQGGMSSVKKDSESDRNISKPYGSRGADSDNEKSMSSTDTEIRDSIRDKAEYILASKVSKIEDIDEYIFPLIYDNNRDMDDDDFERVTEKLIKMAEMEDLSDPSRRFYSAVGDAVVQPYKFLKMSKPTGESIDKDRFRAKFFSLVEAKKREAEMKTAKGKKAEEKMDEGKKSTKKKPDDDGDGVPNWADEKPGKDDRADKKPAGKKGMSAKQAKYFGKKKSVKESMTMEREVDGDEFGDEGPEDLLYAVEREIKNPGSSIDNLVDVLNATFGSNDSPEFEKARRIIEKYIELVTVTDIDHYDDDDDDRSTPAIAAMKHGNIQRHIREYDLTDRLVHASAMLEKVIRQSESADYGGRYKIGGPKGKLPESQRRYKKVVAESRETKMSFRDMMRLVVESGGQQQIDPLDKELFAWATRVAQNKLGDGMKSEVYAGLVYERMGGRFDMYDVLSENQEKKN